MNHRRTPARKAYVPASWFIVLTIMLCVGAAGWLGWLFVDDPSEDTTPTATSPAPAVTTPSPTRTTEDESEPTPEPTPTETETTEPAVERDAPVSVLNNTTIQGLAGTFSAKVSGAGWTVAGVGNWRGQIAGNTVYFPPGLEDRGRLLAEDVDIDRVLPSVAPMRMDRLTIILSGPQQ